MPGVGLIAEIKAVSDLNSLVWKQILDKKSSKYIIIALSAMREKQRGF